MFSYFKKDKRKPSDMTDKQYLELAEEFEKRCKIQDSIDYEERTDIDFRGFELLYQMLRKINKVNKLIIAIIVLFLIVFRYNDTISDTYLKTYHGVFQETTPDSVR